MKKYKHSLIIFLVLIICLVCVPAVAAHPLGNFTISHYSRLAVSAARVDLLYVIDMAEIPTFQERQQMDTDGNGVIAPPEQQAYLQQQTATLARNLELIINGDPALFKQRAVKLTFPPGQGDLPTLRLEMELTAVLPPTEEIWDVAYTDHNFAGRLGWQEIVVQPTGDAHLLASSVPAEDVSNQLQNYPDDLLQDPLATHQAFFQFQPSASPSKQGVGDTAVTNAAPVDTQNRFGQDELANLLTTLDTPGALAIALVVAFGLGAAHALTPGHGKTIVGAYLVGSRGTARHALFLGLTTTITHTVGVFAFGLLVLFASQFILPETLFPWLGVISGLLILLIGLSLFSGHLHRWRGYQAESHESGYHTHGGVGHTHQPGWQSGMGWRNLLALGISGGLLPCPSALILLLSAVALQQVGFGIILIVAFSIGLAAVLTGIGLALVYAGRLFEKIPVRRGRFLTRLLPMASALFISVAGLIIMWQALVETL